MDQGSLPPTIVATSFEGEYYKDSLNRSEQEVWALLGLSLEAMAVDSQTKFEAIMHSFEAIIHDEAIAAEMQDLARTQLSEFFAEFPDYTESYLVRQVEAALDTEDDALFELSQKRLANFLEERAKQD